MDYGEFNSLPVWDRKLADFLQPLAPISTVLLIATALFTIWVAFKYHNKPELQILFLAFLWSP